MTTQGFQQMRRYLYILCSILSLFFCACYRETGCPGVHYYTTPAKLKGHRESDKTGTGAWTKKNKHKDFQKAKSGIMPKHMKRPPKPKKKKKATQKSSAAQKKNV